MIPQSKTLRWIWLPIARAIGFVLLTILGTVKITGKSRLPKKGGFVMISNHLSDVDPIVIQYASPRILRFMGKSELFEMKGVGAAMRIFQVFPIRRGEPDRESIRFAVDLLKSGQVVCMFPEGELSETTELMELKPGVGLIIRLAQCPVVCCGLKGTNRWMPYGKLTPQFTFRRSEVVFGEPIQFSKDDTNEVVMARIEAELRSLLA